MNHADYSSRCLHRPALFSPWRLRLLLSFSSLIAIGAISVGSFLQAQEATAVAPETAAPAAAAAEAPSTPAPEVAAAPAAEATPAPAAETPPAEAPAAAASTEAAAPALPDYMTVTNPPEGTPKWPDGEGANAAIWATPAGANGDVPGALTNEDLYGRIVHNLFSINVVWIIICGAMVMFMQLGFMMVEVGLCRAKNSAHTAAMNLMIYPLGCLAFYVYGFALGWGNWWSAPVPEYWYATMGPGVSVLNSSVTVPFKDTKGGDINLSLVGTKGFCLLGVNDVSVMTLFFFMMVFMDTTATIPTGTLAERWAWNNFVIYGLWVALPYCIYAHWVWGGGWLAQLGKAFGLGHGAVDFAGSGVVHAMGGALALAGGLIMGPRLGKFVNGKPQAMPGHNIPMVIGGTFVLAFGWFGFNAGSTLSGTDLRLATVVVNTMLASVAGAISCMWYMQLTGMKPDPSMICNGMLAGLVAITAPCAFVYSQHALLIGAIAGVLVVVSVFFWDRVGVDDPVGAISVHGVNGIWGLISLGIFANGEYGDQWNGVKRSAPYLNDVGKDCVRGLLYGDAGQLVAQLISAVTVVVFGFVVGYILFKLTNMITPMRVSREAELAGVDIPEMGAMGYPDFVLSARSTHE